MSNYIRNTSCHWKLWFYVVLPNCSEYGNFIYVAEIWIIVSHTAGTVWLNEDWLSPDWSASSNWWNEPMSGKPSVVSICNSTGRAWFLAHVKLQVWPRILKFHEDCTCKPKAVDDIYVAALPIAALLPSGMNVKHAETPRSYVCSRKLCPQLLFLHNKCELMIVIWKLLSQSK